MTGTTTSAGIEITYGYNGEGLRVFKTTNGKTPVLYIDLANPASNKAYKNVGFIECGKVSEILFEMRN